MEQLDIEIPNSVGVMTLPNAILFPQAIMPLYIFEPRYRNLLKDALESHRLFAVAGLDEKVADETDRFEPPYETASLGLVRACQHNEDGTANLVLQGVSRIQIKRIIEENPYRRIEIAPLQTVPGSGPDELSVLRSRLTRVLFEHRESGGEVPGPFLSFLKTVDQPEAFVDLVAYAVCNETSIKQELLANLNTSNRFQRLLSYLETKTREIQLVRKLQGKLKDEDVHLN